MASSKDQDESRDGAQTAQARPVDNRQLFPKTNKEYFRVLLKSGLICSIVIFLILFVVAGFLAPRRGWTIEEFARSAAISLLAGFNLALVRLRWLKGRDR